MSRYLDGLLHAIARVRAPSDELIIYYNSLDRRKLFDDGVRERAIRMPKATPWHQVRVPLALRADHCDVYLGGANVVPAYSRVPSVVVIHDCKAFRVPDLVDRGSRLYFRTWQPRSVRKAAAVIADSEWGADECEHWLGIRPTLIAYPGLDPLFSPAPDTATEAVDLRTRFGLGEGPFALQVGAFEAHKGGDTAVRGVELARARGVDVTLVRCGRHGAVASWPGLVDLGHVDDATLRALYRTAAVVCVPSTHEGFGLPVAEAMASGTPVIAVRACALPEVGGDAAMYIEPGDSSQLADHLQALLADPADAERRRALGLTQAGRFRWEDTAASVLELLRSVA
jgi:glycosyltransferase involved in cell wall biosynthesis